MKASLVILFLLTGPPAHGAGRFEVHLNIDYESAERTIGLFRGTSGHPSSIASLRGSLISLATTELLAGRRLSSSDLEDALEGAKFNQISGEDVFHMKEARGNVELLNELLTAAKQRNFASKVVHTVEQLFPEEARISTTIPMFFVAFGHQNIDAFVRRVEWQDGQPVFVGEGKGDLTIVVNLSKAVYYGRTLDERFIGLLSVVAHEVFHAAFGVYKDGSPVWQDYYRRRTGHLDRLLDLTHNEGIAHYLSLIQRTGGRLRDDQIPKVNAAFEQFNRNADQLSSRGISPAAAGQLIRNSNSSGYWESYGAITGMIIARQIDQTLGRQALMDTITEGPDVFFATYVGLMKKDSGAPRLSERIGRWVGAE